MHLGLVLFGERFGSWYNFIRVSRVACAQLEFFFLPKGVQMPLIHKAHLIPER